MPGSFKTNGIGPGMGVDIGPVYQPTRINADDWNKWHDNAAANERKKKEDEKKKKAEEAAKEGEYAENFKYDGNFGPAETVSKQQIPHTQTINPLAYSTLIRDFNRFRAIARSESDMYDMPGHVFFRVLFHFDNGSDVRESAPGILGATVASPKEENWTGLLAPSWYEVGESFGFNIESSADIEKLWRSSTAFNYFVLNGDIPRARMTKQFVELLSSISANSPWYFQNIKGLDAAIERTVTAPNAEFEVKTERDKITIECLDDSYDQRIGTLLDLYRAIVWSWETKRQMLPANLRKFDMTIIAFQLPLRGKHVSRYDINMGKIKNELTSEDAKTNTISNVVDVGGVTQIYTSDSTSPIASFKAWEFHGCEIDYNSSKSGWGELDNAIGSIPKYNIEIFFDDVFETRFNEFTNSTITDIVGDDVPYSYDNSTLFPSEVKRDKESVKLSIPKNYSKPAGWPHLQGPQSVGVNMFGATPGHKSGLIDQIVGAGTSWVGTKLKKIYLGNMNGLSISKIGQQINQFLDGDLWGTVNNVANYVRKDYDGGHAQLGSNIFPEPEMRGSDRIVNLGNIFRTNTALNT